MTTVTTRVGNLLIPKNDEITITTRRNNEVNSISIIALDGLNCGVPTITTPTMTPVTPTTFREFGQTISDSHQNEAGFVPPLVQPPMSSMLNSSVNVTTPTTISDNVGGGYTVSVADLRNWQGGSTIMPELLPLNNTNCPQSISSASSPPIPTHVISMGQGGSGSSSSSSTSSSSGGGRSRKNTGGRRPNRENGISPEEQQKKIQRRERNKIAAAKCRQKRTELIKSLEQSVEKLQEEKYKLGEQMQALLQQKEDLEETLEIHQSNCPLNGRESPEDVKPFINGENYSANMTMAISDKSFLSISANNQMSRIFTSINTSNVSQNVEMQAVQTTATSTSSSSSSINVGKQRPNYLPVTSLLPTKNHKVNMADANGVHVPFTTPSTEYMNAFMTGESTGLTPIAASVFGPSCSTQLRNTNTIDLASPESIPTKLVSL